jgi:hypothetical protein
MSLSKSRSERVAGLRPNQLGPDAADSKILIVGNIAPDRTTTRRRLHFFPNLRAACGILVRQQTLRSV